MKKNYLKLTFIICAVVCLIAAIFSLFMHFRQKNYGIDLFGASLSFDGNSIVYVVVIILSLALILIFVRIGINRYIKEYERVKDELEVERFRSKAVRRLSDEIVFEYDKVTDTLRVYPSVRSADSREHNPYIIEELKSKVEAKTLPLLHPADYEVVKTVIEGIVPQGLSIRLERHIADEKCLLIYEVRAVRKMLSKNSQLVVGTLIPVCENDEQRDFLSRLYLSDELTGLKNKAAAARAIDKLLRKRPRSSALAVIDFDDFTDVNGQFGQITGDVILKSFVSELKNIFSENDVLSRIGGDEFMIYIADASDKALLEENCNKILNLFSEGNTHSAVRDNMRMSIGISLYPKDGLNYTKLYGCALSALSKAKAEGKNKIMYFSKK